MIILKTFESIVEISRAVVYAIDCWWFNCEFKRYRDVLQHGADKVIVNTSLLKDNSLISQFSNTFGSQCISVAIDYRINNYGSCDIFHSSGKYLWPIDPCEWAKQCKYEGAGEIVLTSIDNDGSLDGFDFQLSRSIQDRIDLPVIISCGCGSVNHFLMAFNHGLSAASAGSFFFKRDFNLMQCRSF